MGVFLLKGFRQKCAHGFFADGKKRGLIVLEICWRRRRKNARQKMIARWTRDAEISVAVERGAWEKLSKAGWIYCHFSTRFDTFPHNFCGKVHIWPFGVVWPTSGCGLFIFCGNRWSCQKSCAEKNFSCGKVFFRSLGYVENSWHLLEKRAWYALMIK